MEGRVVAATAQQFRCSDIPAIHFEPVVVSPRQTGRADR
jgi:hypothetical protein